MTAILNALNDTELNTTDVYRSPTHSFEYKRLNDLQVLDNLVVGESYLLASVGLKVFFLKYLSDPEDIVTSAADLLATFQKGMGRFADCRVMAFTALNVHGNYADLVLHSKNDATIAMWLDDEGNIMMKQTTMASGVQH